MLTSVQTLILTIQLKKLQEKMRYDVLAVLSYENSLLNNKSTPVSINVSLRKNLMTIFSTLTNFVYRLGFVEISQKDLEMAGVLFGVVGGIYFALGETLLM